MLSNYNKWKVLQVFFDSPTKNIQIREISRTIELAPKSVMKYLGEFVELGLIIRKEEGVFPSYKANRDNALFIFYKKMNTIMKISESGILEYIEDSCIPDAIILFGSCARGEDIEDSDMDIFVLSKEKKLDLSRFEQKLKRKVSLFFEEHFNELSKELRNNVINGIILKGYLKVF